MLLEVIEKCFEKKWCAKPNISVQFRSIVRGEFGHKGQGLNIYYGWHTGIFGDYLIAVSDRHVVGLAFKSDKGRTATENNLFGSWQRASFLESFSETEPYTLGLVEGACEIEILALGTQFQIKVWEALLTVPLGEVVSYQRLASMVGVSRGARAIGRAVAKNPLAWLIPCHRVIKLNGDLAGYRWGSSLKSELLLIEKSKSKRYIK